MIVWSVQVGTSNHEVSVCLLDKRTRTPAWTSKHEFPILIKVPILSFFICQSNMDPLITCIRSVASQLFVKTVAHKKSENHNCMVTL